MAVMASSQRILLSADDATGGRLAARQRSFMVIRQHAARQGNLLIL
jgi:hypothetical protein